MQLRVEDAEWGTLKKVPSEKEAGGLPWLLVILREVIRVQLMSATGLEWVALDKGASWPGVSTPKT